MKRSLFSRHAVTAALMAATMYAPNAFAQRAMGQAQAIPEDIGVPKDGNTIRVCCPPIASQSHLPFFRVQQQPGKNITQTYGLDFLPNAAMDLQMKAYAPFAGLFVPAGGTANSVLLNAEMKDLGSNPPTAVNFSNPSFATPVYQHALRGWWTTGSGTWNGPATTHGSFPSHFWEKEYNDDLHVSTGHMQPNRWYMVKLTYQLAYFDQARNWNQTKINCMEKYVAVRVNAVGFKAGPGASAASAAEIVEVQ